MSVLLLSQGGDPRVLSQGQSPEQQRVGSYRADCWLLDSGGTAEPCGKTHPSHTVTLTGASTLNPSLSPPPLHQSILQVCLSAACSRSVPRSTVQPALVSGERGRCVHMTVGVKLWEEQAPGWKTVTGGQLTAVNRLSVHWAGAWSRTGQAAGTSACGSSGASLRPSAPAL